MKNVPLSFFYSWKDIPDSLYDRVMAEFAANGAKRLVLGDLWCERLLGDLRLYSNLERRARAAGLTLFEAHAPFGECFDLNCSVAGRRPGMIADQIKVMNYAAAAGCKTYTLFGLTFYKYKLYYSP